VPVLQANKATDAEVYSQKIAVKKCCIDYSTRFSTKLLANGLAICFSKRMYQIGSCVCHNVIRHIDFAEVKGNIVAIGTK